MTKSDQNGGAITQGLLGEKLCLEKSNVSRLLEGLERRDWIIRTKNPKDSRQKLVTPTPKVLVETVERCSNIARTILKETHRCMTEEKQLACQSALLHIISNLNKGANDMGGEGLALIRTRSHATDLCPVRVERRTNGCILG